MAAIMIREPQPSASKVDENFSQNHSLMATQPGKKQRKKPANANTRPGACGRPALLRNASHLGLAAASSNRNFGNQLCHFTHLSTQSVRALPFPGVDCHVKSGRDSQDPSCAGGFASTSISITRKADTRISPNSFQPHQTANSRDFHDRDRKKKIYLPPNPTGTAAQ